MWVSIKSEPQNKKLFQVSSKKDNFDYAMKSIDWELPDELKNSGYAPVKLDVPSDCILEEKFTVLKDYLFNDEGSGKGSNFSHWLRSFEANSQSWMLMCERSVNGSRRQSEGLRHFS